MKLAPFFGRKLNGGILLYALFACFISGIICTAIFFSFYTRQVEEQLSEIPALLNRNATSGINYLLADEGLTSFQDTLVLDLYGQGTDSVKLYKKQWGLFELCFSEAFSHTFNYQKIAFTGNETDNQQPVLYLADIGKPLSLSGNTHIEGEAYLPKAGVKRAYIEGVNYSGNKLIYGTTKASIDTLPNLSSINKRVNDNMKALRETINTKDFSILQDSLTNSFSNPPILFASNYLIDLNNKQLEGAIIIQSKTGIIVRKNCRIKNVIFIAPFISIDSNVTATIQLIAEDSLLIGNNVSLNYPSSLILQKRKNSVNSKIDVGKNSIIEGEIVVLKDESDDKTNTLLAIYNGAQITGNIYVEGLVDLKGSVFGSITCNGFYLRTPSSIYENHLLNATINKSKLPSYYVGNQFLNNGKRKIVAWLY